MTTYLLASDPGERERLELQSRVWEAAGRSLLGRLPGPRPRRVVDLGCGCLGWLRILSEHVGPDGEVVGTDIDPDQLERAQELVEREGLTNVRLVRDDIFDSDLSPRRFDLVHARFQVAPLGRGPDIVATMTRLAAPGAHLVLEDPDSSSWRFNPPAPAAETLTRLVVDAFRRRGTDFDAGRTDADLLRDADLAPTVHAEVLALAPGHPYLALPVQFARSLAGTLSPLVPPEALDRLLDDATDELSDPHRWGTTFALVQTVARMPETSHPTP